MFISAILLGFLILAVIVILWAIGIYNDLVTKRNRYKNAFAQIDVQLKRRYDLIPNLVETVKGYLKHERETLEAVINARNQAHGASNNAAANPSDSKAMQSLNHAEGELTNALNKLMVVVEQYPDLKANQNMLSLQEELTSTENKISFAHQAYNDSVTNYNTKCEIFPANIIASNFNFQQATLFEVESISERNAPKVSF
ncbi:MAG: LemA family protein [Planctomycetaceae bacterium]|jgi:LemA protein|nr:LemA family protein [Planctomycetaceae bacterium]